MEIVLAELVGTAILVLLGNGVVANVVLKETKGNSSGWIVITTGWGLAVAIAVYSVGQISGAHINPAVTLGLLAIGQVEAALVPNYLVGQLLGGFIGAVLVWMTYKPHWAATEEPADKLACFGTGPAIADTPWNLFAEFIGTAMLVFGVLAIGTNFSKLPAESIDLATAFSTGINPLLVGILVWSIGLSLGGPTGYAINPARDFAPRLAHALLPIAGKGSSNWGYAWIPVVGPIAGGVAGALLFRALGY
ncbi:aquaporin family protein [Pirellulales bacterium]|nr:aquaporin family protein [Pirellulales bacterium]